MTWPLASDFCRMVQQPRLAFRDPVLQECQIERDALKQPRVWSGQFAVVFKAVGPEGKARPSGLSPNQDSDGNTTIGSANICNRPAALSGRFRVPRSAIRSAGDGKWYPLVVMDWVEGSTLFEWLQAKCREGKGAVIGKGGRHWADAGRRIA